MGRTYSGGGRFYHKDFYSLYLTGFSRLKQGTYLIRLKSALQIHEIQVYNRDNITLTGEMIMKHIDEIQIAGTAILLCGAMFAVSAVAPTGNTVSKAVTNFTEAPETAAEAQAQAEAQAEEDGFTIYTLESNYDYDNSYDDSSYNDTTYDTSQDNSDQGYADTDNGDGSSDDGSGDQTQSDDTGYDSSDQIDYSNDDIPEDNSEDTSETLDSVDEGIEDVEQITY